MSATELIAVATACVAIASFVAALVAGRRATALNADTEQRLKERQLESEKRFQGLIHQLDKTDRDAAQALERLETRVDFIDDAIMESWSVSGEINPEWMERLQRRRPDLDDIYVKRRGWRTDRRPRPPEERS